MNVKQLKPAASTASNDRSLPCNVEAEKKVLGALIRAAEEQVFRVRDFLRPDHFYMPSHQIIYQKIMEIVDKGGRVDLVVLADGLQRDGDLETVGGPFYLADLPLSVATSVNASYHAQLVVEKAERRRIIRMCSEILAEAHDAELSDLIARMQMNAMELSTVESVSGPRKLGDVMPEVLISIQDKMARIAEGKPHKKYSTGLMDLDRLIGGFNPGEVVVIGARPSDGKTSLGANLARNLSQYGTVVIFSLEQPMLELGERFITSESMISIDSQHGPYSQAEAQQIISTANKMKDWPIYVDDKPSLSIEQIISRTHRIGVEAPPVVMVVIDYLLLVGSSPNMRSDERRQQWDYAMKRSKVLAKDQKCVVVMLQQLRRDAEKERRPRLSDLKETGASEEDADIVILIHRPTETKKNDIGERFLLVEKHRNGKTGEVSVLFRPDLTRFDNMAQDHAGHYLDDDQVPF